MNKRLLIIAVLLIPIAVISFREKETNFSLLQEPNVIVRLKINGEIRELPLEEYLVGVVAAEMPALFHEEALKAQSIAARTYALSKLDNSKEYDLVATTADQAYLTIEQMKEKWAADFALYYEKIKECVAETKNIVITYNNELISAYYFSMSNGYTEDAMSVFNEDKEYLKSVEVIWDNEELRNYIVEVKMTENDFCSALGIQCSNLEFNILSVSSTNRVLEVELNNTKMSGVEFRSKLGLRSTDFTITRLDGYIYIETRGYGHGVGMSQYGANGMANEGKKYTEILAYYYQNTELVNYNSIF